MNQNPSTIVYLAQMDETCNKIVDIQKQNLKGEQHLVRCMGFNHVFLFHSSFPVKPDCLDMLGPRSRADGNTTCSISMEARSNRQLCSVSSLGAGRP